MSSYYFPFGASSVATLQNISHSLTAMTASVPFTKTITAITASFASTSGSIPPNGMDGINQTAELCGPSTVLGPTGPQGVRGVKGTNNLICPAGTIACTDLDQYILNLNIAGNRASGSQFIKVCMEIPPGCTSANATCPPYLPSASVFPKFPSII